MAAQGTAERISAYAHVLRSLVHGALGVLPAEPRLDVKRALGRHAHEDARSIDAVLARLGDLPDADPGRPAAPLAARLERLASPDYVRVAYGSIKPALAQRLREHRDAIDPLLDEPTLELVVTVLGRQERHLDEAPTQDADALDLDLRIEPGARPPLPPITAHTGRDPWIEEATADGTLQQALSAELAAAEILARTSHESPDQPWTFHADLARLVGDRMRHVGALEAELTRNGRHWGADQPAPPQGGLGRALELARSAAAAYPPLADDLVAFERITERWR